jgi:peptidoglycan/LPS O-acetylase OafA/YrhL
MSETVQPAGGLAAPTTGKFRLGHRPELDGIRGVSIMFVVCFHGRIPPWSRGGFLGVDVFFVLSGFLITILLIQEWEKNGRIDFKKFYARRALRLFPALALLLVVVCIYAAIVHDPELEPRLYKAALVTALYVSNWIVAFRIGSLHPLNQTWSLAIEEQFYLFWPLILFTLLRLRASRRTILTTTAAVIVGSAVIRGILYSEGAVLERLYAGLDTRADALLIGCLIGLMAPWGMLPSTPSAIRITQAAGVAGAVLVLALSVVATKPDGYLYLGVLTLVGASVGAVLVALLVTPSDSGWVKPLKLRPLVWIGRVSYGMYLWHYSIFWAIDQAAPDWPLVLTITVKLSLALVMTTASFYLLEQPCLRFKDRFRVQEEGRRPERLAA